MSDYKTILRGCLNRDRRAQLEFYMQFYKSVYNSCYRILGNPQESEEVMQETFLKVLDRIENYREDACTMERILKRMAVNRSIDIYRKRKIKFVELNDQLDYTEDTTATENDEIRIEAISKMMQLLPQGYRLILNLHLIEEMDYTDIASRLQLSPSTVRSQYARAKQKLTELIKKNYSHEQLLG